MRRRGRVSLCQFVLRTEKRFRAARDGGNRLRAEGEEEQKGYFQCWREARVEWREEEVAQAAVREDCSAEGQAGVEHLIGGCACRSHWVSTHGGREQPGGCGRAR